MTSGGDFNCPRIVPSCHHDEETALPTDLHPLSVRAMHASNLNNASYNQSLSRPSSLPVLCYSAQFVTCFSLRIGVVADTLEVSHFQASHHGLPKVSRPFLSKTVMDSGSGHLRSSGRLHISQVLRAADTMVISEV
jgi:hypothetical protein